CQHSHGTPLTF
nr:immunoglobulin light chain junction region [Macaca mulatta]